MIQNYVSLEGNMARDAELRYTQGDQPLPYLRFSLGVSKPNRQGQTQPAGANFIDCVAYRNNAERLSQQAKKGSRVRITGHLDTSSYEKDGRKIYTTTVIVDEFRVYDRQGGQQQGGYQQGGYQQGMPAQAPVQAQPAGTAPSFQGYNPGYSPAPAAPVPAPAVDPQPQAQPQYGVPVQQAQPVDTGFMPVPANEDVYGEDDGLPFN